MKTLLILAAATAALTATSAPPEKITSEQIQKIAPKLLEPAGRISGAQFKIDPDSDKGDGLKGGEVGVVVLPDRNLTAEKLEKAGSEIIPLGQLYLKGVVPAKNGKPADNDRMHILMIEDKGETHRIWLCLLGARKNGDKLELVLYGSEKAPLSQVALRKVESAQDLPIEVSGEKQDDESASLTLNILGKYKATLVVMKQEG